jgi:DNA invertase Pin-like site-specific DNA recombinase
MQEQKRAVIYTRVSTDDQNCARQIQELNEFARKAGYLVTATFTETASGTKNDRKERAKVMALAKSRDIDAILVTEISRWGRSTADLITSLEDLCGWNVSLVAPKCTEFDMSTASGRMLAGVLAVFSRFERDLLSERTKSGLKAAVAKGKKLGRPAGNKTIAKHAKKVLALIDEGRSYREIARILGISKTTVVSIVKQHQAA